MATPGLRDGSSCDVQAPLLGHESGTAGSDTQRFTATSSDHQLNQCARAPSEGSLGHPYRDHRASAAGRAGELRPDPGTPRRRARRRRSSYVFCSAGGQFLAPRGELRSGWPSVPSLVPSARAPLALIADPTLVARQFGEEIPDRDGGIQIFACERHGVLAVLHGIQHDHGGAVFHPGHAVD